MIKFFTFLTFYYRFVIYKLLTIIKQDIKKGICIKYPSKIESLLLLILNFEDINIKQM